MKLKYLSSLALPLLLLLCTSELKSTTQVVTVGNFIFTPSNFNIIVGDTIKWQWESGTHTTTSTTIPAGAVAWNAPMDVSHTTFIYKVTVVGTYNYVCTFHAPGMAGSFTVNPIGIKRQEGWVPTNFELYQNYPNPFNPTTTIKFDVPQNSFVKLIVSDILGREVAVIVNEELSAGRYTADWDAGENASGIYFYRLTAGSFERTMKMSLVK